MTRSTGLPVNFDDVPSTSGSPLRRSKAVRKGVRKVSLPKVPPPETISVVWPPESLQRRQQAPPYAVGEGVKPPGVIRRKPVARAFPGLRSPHSAVTNPAPGPQNHIAQQPGVSSSRSASLSTPKVRNPPGHLPAAAVPRRKRTETPMGRNTHTQPQLSASIATSTGSLLRPDLPTFPDPYALKVAARLEDKTIRSDSRREGSDNAGLGGRRKIDKPDSPASSLRAGSVGSTISGSTPRRSKFTEGEPFTHSSFPIHEKAVVTRSSSPIPKKTADKDRPRWRDIFKWPKREEATQSPGRRTESKDRPASRGKESGRVEIVNASGFPVFKVDRRTSFERQRDALEEEQIRLGNGWKVV